MIPSAVMSMMVSTGTLLQSSLPAVSSTSVLTSESVLASEDCCWELIYSSSFAACSPLFARLPAFTAISITMRAKTAPRIINSFFGFFFFGTAAEGLPAGCVGLTGLGVADCAEASAISFVPHFWQNPAPSNAFVPHFGQNILSSPLVSLIVIEVILHGHLQYGGRFHDAFILLKPHIVR